MALPWEQRKDEAIAEYDLFLRYLDIPPYLRSIQRLKDLLAKVGGLQEDNIRQIAIRLEWDLRASAYDAHTIATALESRRLYQESLRSEFYKEARRAMSTVSMFLQGRLPQNFDRERKTGRPVVKPSTVLSTAFGVLDRCGVTIPRRTDITGSDGLELERRGARLEAAMGQEELRDLLIRLEGAEVPGVPPLGKLAMGEDETAQPPPPPQETEPPPPPVKRGPGRPRTRPIQPKRPRGRPRKDRAPEDPHV